MGEGSAATDEEVTLENLDGNNEDEKVKNPKKKKRVLNQWRDRAIPTLQNIRLKFLKKLKKSKKFDHHQPSSSSSSTMTLQ